MRTLGQCCQEDRCVTYRSCDLQIQCSVAPIRKQGAQEQIQISKSVWSGGPALPGVESHRKNEYHLSEPWLEARWERPPSSVPFDIMLKVLANAIRQEKEIKYTVWEGRNKTVFVYRWHDCLCRKSERKKQRNKQTLPRTNIKVAGYKINMQKLIAFLQTSNEQVELKCSNIYISIPQNETLRYKPNKICTASIIRKITQLFWRKSEN